LWRCGLGQIGNIPAGGVSNRIEPAIFGGDPVAGDFSAKPAGSIGWTSEVASCEAALIERCLAGDDTAHLLLWEREIDIARFFRLENRDGSSRSDEMA